jgi:hypothetical protein
LILRNDLLSYLLLTEQSPACCDCSRCGPNWVGCLASSIVQKDGNSILYCQGQGPSWNCKLCYVLLHSLWLNWILWQHLVNGSFNLFTL